MPQIVMPVIGTVMKSPHPSRERMNRGITKCTRGRTKMLLDKIVINPVKIDEGNDLRLGAVPNQVC